MNENCKINIPLLNTNIGPEGRKAFLNKIAEDYHNGNEESSIYFQVRALFNLTQDQYFRMREIFSRKEQRYKTAYTEMKFPSNNTNDNKLLENALKTIKSANARSKDFFINNKFIDFLKDYHEPIKGFKKIVDICQEFPTVWTILQVCKGPRPQTTYLTAEDIHKHDGDIYLTILRHARSSEYPEPICLRFSDSLQIKLFDEFSRIVSDCKAYMQVEPKEVTTHAAKLKYWENLKLLDRNIREAIDDLRHFVFPWLFLFRGLPWRKNATSSKKYQFEAFAAVDELCFKYQWKRKERILLSLAALHVIELSDDEIEGISENLSSVVKEQVDAQQLLKKLQLSVRSLPITQLTDKETTYIPTNYPCILIVDEHLDHFYWEELNIEQELCRFNSMQCLWNLYTTHKSKIQKGYLCLNIKSGAFVINPDNNLPNAQMRLESFSNYWKPSWSIKCAEKPTSEELLQDYFKRDCYVYAGHGSGLQHINGKEISKHNIASIVFLFGCESTRMTSNGLYGDFVGPHIYYHAAMCPCLIGAILPALDTHMDNVSVELITRWITPDSKDVLIWPHIDMPLWTKKGIIEAAADSEKTTIGKATNYQIGSLCGVITRIHSRCNNKYYYSTVPYVCRGLPVWNKDIQQLPE